MSEWEQAVGPAPWGPPPAPLETLGHIEQMGRTPWAEAVGPTCICGIPLGESGDHADDTPRCTTLEYRGGIIADNVGELLGDAERLLRGIEKLGGESSAEPGKPRRRWLGGGGSGQAPKAPPLRGITDFGRWFR